MLGWHVAIESSAGQVRIGSIAQNASSCGLTPGWPRNESKSTKLKRIFIVCPCGAFTFKNKLIWNKNKDKKENIKVCHAIVFVKLFFKIFFILK
jgi:hypothetical protein